MISAGPRQVGLSLDRCMKQAKKIVETIQHHQAVCEIADDNSSLDTSVLLRVRPIINREKKSGYYPIAFCKDRATQIYAPNFKVLTDMSIDVNHFRFTGNYGQTTTQIEFLESFHGVVDRTMARSGMFTCFAYGQTGSGKTYSISAITQSIVQQIPFGQCLVEISLTEIIGIECHDLVSKRPIQVLVDSNNRPVCLGETFVNVHSSDAAWELIQAGFASRKTASTLKNDTSSRSHFICKIILESDAGSSQILLVDLSGSERQADSIVHSAARMKESIAINTSLMVLKECIRTKALARTDPNIRIPYRNSKLTMLLKDVFFESENGRRNETIMVATVSPTIADVSHTLNTFRYACALNPELRKAQTPKRTTPMSWKLQKLQTWFEEASNGLVQLGNVCKLQAVSGNGSDFVSPPWKYLYDLSVNDWSRKFIMLSKTESAALRNAYRSLFLAPTISYNCNRGLSISNNCNSSLQL